MATNYTITVRDTSGSVVSTFTQNDQGIITPIRCSINQWGYCTAATLIVRNDITQIQAQQFVTINIDGTDLFYGVVTRNPSTDSPGAGEGRDTNPNLETIELVGAMEAYRTAVTGATLINDLQSPTDIRDAILSIINGIDGLSGAIIVDPANFGITGYTITEWYAPEREALEAIQQLADAAPDYFFGVAADRKTYFVQWTGVTIVQFDDLLSFETVPYETSDIVTKVRLVISGTYAGATPSISRTQYFQSASATEVVGPYIPRPIVYEYTDAAHTTYNAVRTFSLNEGVNPFKAASAAPAIDFSAQLITNGVDYRDDDPATYAKAQNPGTAGTPTRMEWYGGSGAPGSRDNWWGFYLRYICQVNDPISPENVGFLGDDIPGYVYVRHSSKEPATSYPLYWTEAYWAVPPTDAYGAEVWAVFPNDAAADNANWLTSPAWDRDGGMDVFLWVEQGGLDTGVTDPLRIVEFYPLDLDTALLDELCKRRVRVPGTTPTVIELAGRIPYNPNITINGYPGGSLNLPATQYEYILDQDGYRTRITLDAVREDVSSVEAQELLNTVIDRNTYAQRLAQRQ